MDINNFLILFPSIIIGLTLHEYAHGYVAYKLGDPTAKLMGRLSLNPMRHLDLMGTLMLLLVHFGWAKPVPVNPNNLRNPRRDMLLVALAGPAMNLTIAIVFGLIIRILISQQMETVTAFQAVLNQFLIMGLLINVSLAVFNMLPVPPLDGSRIIAAVVPPEYEMQYRSFERYASMGLFGLMMISFIFKIPIISTVLVPIVNLLTGIIIGVKILG